MRLWNEPLGQGQTEVRGEMKYLPSGAVCYFRTWAVLEAFFGQKLAESRSTKDDTGQEVMMKQYCLSTMKGGYADEWHEA